MNLEDIELKSSGAGFALIMERLPEERQALRRLFQENLSFQSPLQRLSGVSCRAAKLAAVNLRGSFCLG